MKMKPIKADYYLLKSQLEPQYRNTPESVYVKIHLPPYFDNGKAKYRPYRFPICKVIPKYFGKPDTGFKHDVVTVYDNLKNNSHFTNARDTINRAIIHIETKYGYQLPGNDVLILDINRFIERDTQPQNKSVKIYEEIEEVEKSLKCICLVSIVDQYFDKIVAISKQNRTDARSKHTLDSYKTMIANIKRFVVEYGTVDLLTLTNEKWETIWDVILTYKKGEGNYKYSVVQLMQKQLRSILKKLPSNHIPLMNLNDDLINKNIDPINEHTQLFLSEDELKKLIKISFENPKMEYARKYLIIASLTGQRYQSMREMSGCPIQLNQEYGFYYAHFVHIKTGTHCYCPLFYDVLKLCPDGFFLKVDKVNQNGQYWINKVVLELEIKNNVNISSHTCKKTFVSLLKPYRVKNETISLVTHPTENYSESCVGDYDKSELIYKSEEFYEATVGIVNKYPDTVFRYK
jgi:hypothetical protein